MTGNSVLGLLDYAAMNRMKIKEIKGDTNQAPY